MTFADIASGNTGTADWLFLIAAIVFGIGFLMTFPRPITFAELQKAPWCLLFAGLCLVSVAWLLL